MPEQMSREECLEVLRTKAAQINGLPKKADFTEYETTRIKAFFGPWPRALEAANLLPPKSEGRIAKNKKAVFRQRKREQGL